MCVSLFSRAYIPTHQHTRIDDDEEDDIRLDGQLLSAVDTSQKNKTRRRRRRRLRQRVTSSANERTSSLLSFILSFFTHLNVNHLDQGQQQLLVHLPVPGEQLVCVHELIAEQEKTATHTQKKNVTKSSVAVKRAHKPSPTSTISDARYHTPHTDSWSSISPQQKRVGGDAENRGVGPVYSISSTPLFRKRCIHRLIYASFSSWSIRIFEL